ncbi:MAG TPA: hypothetical protein VKB93_18030 [Thermoanaerobaculia bacterium]|nr:hypothetical protein [Thermoanaerobaculia bacterium]
MSNEFYEPLIERDLEAIPAAARAFAAEHSIDELYLAVARFGVLAYAPSMHSKRAVMACRAAHDVREVMGERWLDLVIECARYVAEARQPWSEPPILTDVALPSREELERDAGDDALLIIDTAFALIPILGEKGKAMLLRMPQLELENPQTRSPLEPLEVVVDRAIASKGAIEDVTRVLVCGAAGFSPPEKPGGLKPAAPPVYYLARDFAQTLIAFSRPPDYRRDEFLAAVKHNLEHGEDFSAWSLA